MLELAAEYADGKIRHYGNGHDLEVLVETVDGHSGVMRRWVRLGLLPKALDTWLSVSTFYTDGNGNCLGKFNPTVKPATDRIGLVYDPDWVLEATPENERRILEEIERRYEEWR